MGEGGGGDGHGGFAGAELGFLGRGRVVWDRFRLLRFGFGDAGFRALIMLGGWKWESGLVFS